MSSTWVNLSLTALLPTCSMRVLSKFKPSPNKPMKTGYASESLLKASCGLAPQTIFLNPVPESINPCIHPSFWGRRVPGTASSKAPPNPRLSDQRQLLYERRSPAPERDSEAQPLPPEKHHADAFAFGGFPIICPKFAQMQRGEFSQYGRAKHANWGNIASFVPAEPYGRWVAGPKTARISASHPLRGSLPHSGTSAIAARSLASETWHWPVRSEEHTSELQSL